MRVEGEDEGTPLKKQLEPQQRRRLRGALMQRAAPAFVRGEVERRPRIHKRLHRSGEARHGPASQIMFMHHAHDMVHACICASRICEPNHVHASCVLCTHTWCRGTSQTCEPNRPTERPRWSARRSSWRRTRLSEANGPSCQHSLRTSRADRGAAAPRPSAAHAVGAAVAAAVWDRSGCPVLARTERSRAEACARGLPPAARSRAPAAGWGSR